MVNGSRLGDLKYTASEMKTWPNLRKKNNMRSGTARLHVTPPSAQQPDAQTRSTYAPVEMLGLGRSVELLWVEQKRSVIARAKSPHTVRIWDELSEEPFDD